MSIYYLLTTLTGVVAQSILGYVNVGQPIEFYGLSLTSIIVTAQLLCTIPFYFAGRSYEEYMLKQDRKLAEDFSKKFET